MMTDRLCGAAAGLSPTEAAQNVFFFNISLQIRLQVITGDNQTVSGGCWGRCVSLDHDGQ